MLKAAKAAFLLFTYVNIVLKNKDTFNRLVIRFFVSY